MVDNGKVVPPRRRTVKPLWKKSELGDAEPACSRAETHFERPTIDLATLASETRRWCRRPAEWTWAEFDRAAERSVFPRSNVPQWAVVLEPHVHGVQWGRRDRSCRVDGVPLRLVLEKAGVRSEQLEFLFEGPTPAPRPTILSRCLSPAGLPSKKARRPEHLARHQNER